MKNGPSLIFMHLASEAHKLAVMLDNRGPSGARINTQKRLLQPDECQSINYYTNDSLLKLKTAYNIKHTSVIIVLFFVDILKKLSLYLFRKLLKSSEITLFIKCK